MWSGASVLVTGGASFIGSHLVDALLARGAKVRVVDDLTSGRLENVQPHLGNCKLDFVQADLREPGIVRSAMRGVRFVFHLAAAHGRADAAGLAQVSLDEVKLAVPQ